MKVLESFLAVKKHRAMGYDKLANMNQTEADSPTKESVDLAKPGQVLEFQESML